MGLWMELWKESEKGHVKRGPATGILTTDQFMKLVAADDWLHRLDQEMDARAKGTVRYLPLGTLWGEEYAPDELLDPIRKQPPQSGSGGLSGVA